MFVANASWFQDNNFIYIAMDYFELGDLKQYINPSPLPEKDSISIIWQVIQAVAWLHLDDCAHRDLRPQVRSRANGIYPSIPADERQRRTF
jgi:serine/threonine protein kinase